ncbi:MAG: hypothetical protein MI757_06265 [Pirellulales bacterium]|nr:hypothetical protein [Pirellulales bacterium]
MSHNMNIIEHPEPDFDLESELPSELAALAQQLTADADFLCERYPAGSTRSNEGAADDAAPASNGGRGASWWLRAAAVVLALTGLGTVFNSGQDPASCTVENNALNHAAEVVVDETPAVVPISALASHTATAKVDGAPIERPASSRIVALPPEPGIDLMKPAPVAASARSFDSFTTAEQEALLDLNTSLRDVSVDF